LLKVGFALSFVCEFRLIWSILLSNWSNNMLYKVMTVKKLCRNWLESLILLNVISMRLIIILWCRWNFNIIIHLIYRVSDLNLIKSFLMSRSFIALLLRCLILSLCYLISACLIHFWRVIYHLFLLLILSLLPSMTIFLLNKSKIILINRPKSFPFFTHQISILYIFFPHKILRLIIWPYITRFIMLILSIRKYFINFVRILSISQTWIKIILVIAAG
jgi:hypothetical protein